MSGKFISAFQVPELNSVPNTNPQSGYYKIYFRNGVLKKYSSSGVESDLFGFTAEVDPIFALSPAVTITNSNISNWNTAYGWGNHANAGYLTQAVANTLYALTTHTHTFASITNKPTSLAGYGILDPVVLTSGSYSNPSWITSLAWSKISGTPTTLGGYGITDAVPSTRTLSINGTSYDLSADRSWTITLPTSTSRVQHLVKAGVPINKGQAVYVTSADGTNMIVGLASNTSEATSSKTMGLLDTTVPTNGFANVVTEGLLDGLDTTGANAAGDPVWLGTNGNLIYGLVNKPYAPDHLVFIGIVTRRNANNGEIFVKVQNGFELDELHNVDARNPSNNDGIFYNSTTQLWEHKQISAVAPTPTLAQVTTAGNTTTNAITVGGLTANNKVYLGSNTPHANDATNIVTVNGIMSLSNGYIRIDGQNRVQISTSGWTWDTAITPTAKGYQGYSIQDFTLRTGSTSYNLDLGLAGQTNLRIANTTGNVLINTTTDAGYKLDVNGTFRAIAPSTGVYLGYNVDIQNQLLANALYVRSGSNILAGLEAYNTGVGGIQLQSSPSQPIIRGAYNDDTTIFPARNTVDNFGDVVIQGGGSERVRFKANGNVGIGTSNPLYKLHVTDSAGDIVYISASTGQSAIIGATGSGTNRMYIGYSPGAENISITSSGVVRLNSITSGNVLIGTTTDAGYKLDVNGTAIVGDTNNYGDVFVVRTPGIGWSFDYQYLKIGVVLKLGTDRLQLRVNNNTAYVYNNGDSGNSSLTVMGGHDGAITQFAPIIFGSGRDASLVRETMRVDNQNQRVGIGTTSPIYNLEVSSTSGTGFGIMSGANSGAEIGFQNRGYGLPRWTIRATGAPDGSSGELTFQRLASSFDLTIKSTGNVLIGTTTDAGYKLDVNGTAVVRGITDVIGGTLRIASTGTLTQPSYITSYSDGGWNFTTYTHERGAGVHYFTSNNGNASIFSASAREGVNINVNSLTTGNPFSISGTVNASSAIARGQLINTTLVAAANNDVLVGLDIAPTFTNGAFTGVTNWGLRVQNSNILLNSDKGIYFGNSGYGILGETALGTLKFYTNSIERLNINNAGVITANGNARFASIGLTGSNIELLNGLWYFNIENDGYGLQVKNVTNVNSVPLRIFKNDNVAIGTIIDGGYKLQVAGSVRFGTGSVGTSFFWDNVNGRLGIGNSTPSYKLEVNGGAFFNENIIIANGDGIKFWVDKVRIAPATIDSLGFYTGTTAGSPLEQMRIVSNGNVLIGTSTDAGYKLDINGTARIQGNTEISRSGADTQLTVARGSGASFTIQAKANSTSSSEGVNLYWTNNTWLKFVLGSSVVANFSNVGNLLVGTSTDAGYKLDVAGTLRNISSVERGFRTEHTNGNNIEFVVGNGSAIGTGNGAMYFNGSPYYSFGGSNNIWYVSVHRVASAASVFQIYGGGFPNSTLGDSIYLGSNSVTGGAFTATSGTQNTVSIGVEANAIWKPTSGNATYNLLTITPRIETSGTYSGTVRGLYINPTLTSITGATIRAIETTSGNVIFNGGNVGIGITNPTEKLHITDSNAGNIFARITAYNSSASAAWVAQNDQVDNVVCRVFGSTVGGTQFGESLNRSASLMANLSGTGKFLIGTYSDTDIVFGANDQGRMRIKSSNGNVLIGTGVDTGHKLRVNGNLNVSGYIDTEATYCSAGAQTNVTVGENATEFLGFNVKTDPYGTWNPISKEWTPAFPGMYMVNLQVKWNAGTSTSNQMNIQILKNASTVGITQDAIPAVIGKTQNLTVMVQMDGFTDSLKFTAYTSNSGGQTVVGEPTGTWTFFTAYRIT